MKKIVLCGCLAILAACGTKKISGDGAGQIIETKMEKKGAARIGKAEGLNNPMKITGATIEGNKLVISLSYAGGCEAHHFELVGSEAVAKSLPPQRSIRLVHTGEYDRCKALVLKTLEFDIRELAYEQKPGSEIILHLDNWDRELKYTYR